MSRVEQVAGHITAQRSDRWLPSALNGTLVEAARFVCVNEGRLRPDLAAALVEAERSIVRSLEEPERAVARRSLDLAALILAGRLPVVPRGGDVTVVATAHDVGPWVRETLESLSDQRDVDLRVVIVEDHSIDETAAVIDEMTDTDSRMCVIRPFLRGGAHARNIGAAVAATPYLGFCDGDDLVPRDAYRRLLDATSTNDPQLVVGRFLRFHPTHWVDKTAEWEGYRTPAVYRTIAAVPDLVFHRACWNKLYRCDWWHEEDITFPEEARANDIVPVTRAYLAASPIAVADGPVYVYRDRPGGSSMTARVGSDESVQAYLRQEAQSARLLVETGDSGLIDVASEIVLERDGPSEVAAYLRSLPAGMAPSESVAAAITDLIQVVPHDRLADAPLAPRLLVEAVKAGRWDLAVAAAATGPILAPTTRAIAWADLLGRLEQDESLGPGDGDIVVHGILPTIDDVVRDHVAGPAAAASAVTALASRVAAHPRWALLVAARDVELGGLLTRAASGEDVTPEIDAACRMSPMIRKIERITPTRLRLEGTYEGDAVLDGLAAVATDGSTVYFPVTATSAGRWTVEVHGRARAGPAEDRLVMVAHAGGRAVHVQVGHACQSGPELWSRFDRTGVRLDVGPANVRLEYRARASRRVVIRAASDMRRVLGSIGRE